MESLSRSLKIIRKGIHKMTERTRMAFEIYRGLLNAFYSFFNWEVEIREYTPKTLDSITEFSFLAVDEFIKQIPDEKEETSEEFRGEE